MLLHRQKQHILRFSWSTCIELRHVWAIPAQNRGQQVRHRRAHWLQPVLWCCHKWWWCTRAWFRWRISIGGTIERSICKRRLVPTYSLPSWRGEMLCHCGSYYWYAPSPSSIPSAGSSIPSWWRVGTAEETGCEKKAADAVATFLNAGNALQVAQVVEADKYKMMADSASIRCEGLCKCPLRNPCSIHLHIHTQSILIFFKEITYPRSNLRASIWAHHSWINFGNWTHKRIIHKLKKYTAEVLNKSN